MTSRTGWVVPLRRLAESLLPGDSLSSPGPVHGPVRLGQELLDRARSAPVEPRQPDAHGELVRPAGLLTPHHELGVQAGHRVVPVLPLAPEGTGILAPHTRRAVR